MSVRAKLYSALVKLALLSIPAALFGFFLLLQSDFAEIRSLRSEYDASSATRSELFRILSDHQDIETGERGFVITRDAAFLAPYNAAKSRVSAGFAVLSVRATGDTPFTAGIERLKMLSLRKIAFAEKVIELTAQGRSSEARDAVAQGEGKAIMDAIRAEIVRLDDDERQRLTQIADSRDAARAELERTTNLVLAAFALLLAIVGIVTARTVRERQSAQVRAADLLTRQRAIFNGAVDGMLLLDEGGLIREINPSVTRMFGYDETDLIGRHNTFLMAHPPSFEDSQAWLNQVGYAGRNGAGERREFAGRRSDGEKFDTDVAVSRFHDGDKIGFIAIIRDVTERKRVERMKTEFVSTVSHELRTPLTSIGGSLGLLSGGAAGELSEKAARLVNIAKKNCERLVRLINDMLDVEKIQAGKMAFDPRHMVLAPLMEQIVQANRPFAQQHGVDIHLRLPPWPQCVMADPDKFEQLLTNLLSNAVKHSSAGNIVEVSTVQVGNVVRVEVADRGDGVPPEFRSRIFTKFAMADSSNSRAHGGTGLGLAIAREIAARHGGDVGFRDRNGGGTIFYVELPLLSDQLTGSVGDRSTSGAPIILHVDSDFDCRRVVAEAFATRARVISASTVDQIRAMMKRQTVSCLVADEALISGSVGTRLIDVLRNEQPSLPLILFTSDETAGSQSGADAALLKGRASLAELVAATMKLIALEEGPPQ